MKLIYILTITTFLFSCHKNKNISAPDESEEINQPQSDTLTHSTIVEALDLKINETSGLAVISENYWTINDSGDSPKIYNFDIKSGKVLKSIEVKDAQNQDWESLTIDKEHLFIGDFGNNTGGRKNLRIFKVGLSELSNSTIENSEVISLTYPDQDQFYSGYNHNFDCEAMVSKGDSLFLFSKNWLDRKCKIYGLSKAPGIQTAKLINEFDSGGTITGASLDKESSTLYLLGYNGIGLYSSFIWIISDWEGSDFFSGTKTKYQLTIGRQTEGIAVDTDGSLLISAEQNRGGYPSLYRVRL